MAEQEWHGMAAHELETRRAEAPPRPGRHAAAAPGPPQPGVAYPRVHLAGNHGANLCQEFQTHDAANLTSEEAHELAWTLFGYCHHTITYMNAQGQIVAQE